MKTTVEISDDLMAEAKAAAQREKTTLRALIEEGLRWAVAHRPGQEPFRLKDGSFRGTGFHPDLKNTSWAAIRAMIYEGRGG